MLDRPYRVLRLQRGGASAEHGGCACTGQCHELVEVVPFEDAAALWGALQEARRHTTKDPDARHHPTARRTDSPQAATQPRTRTPSRRPQTRPRLADAPPRESTGATPQAPDLSMRPHPRPHPSGPTGPWGRVHHATLDLPVPRSAPTNDRPQPWNESKVRTPRRSETYEATSTAYQRSCAETRRPGG